MRGIKKAVIPAAGLGTRMLPLTKNIPKEMLPVGRKPMIQHAVEELLSSGIRDICIVISPEKNVIKEYFISKYSYQFNQNIAQIEKIVSESKLTFVYQHEPLGLGNALMAARDFVSGNTFVLVIPDQILHSNKPATRQILEFYEPDKAGAWSGLVKPPLKELNYFTEHRGYRLSGYHERVYRIVKMTIDIGRVRAFGRVIFPSEVFRFLEQYPGYVDGVGEFVKNVPHFGVFLQGTPFDFGTLEGYYRFLPRFWKLTSNQI